MKNVLIGLIFLVVVGFLCMAASGDDRSNSQTSVPPTKAWYAGGTLHKATASEWLRATDSNRLATSADWVTATIGIETQAKHKEQSEELKECVDETAEVSPPEMKAAELAVSCSVLFGWELKED